MRFVVNGTLRRAPERVSLVLEAENRADALWQAYHGVIEANVSERIPGASIKCDLRTLRSSKKSTRELAYLDPVATAAEIEKSIKRLKTVAYRLNCCLLGKDWTRRKYDADIITLECIPALQRALGH